MQICKIKILIYKKKLHTFDNNSNYFWLDNKLSIQSVVGSLTHLVI